MKVYIVIFKNEKTNSKTTKVITAKSFDEAYKKAKEFKKLYMEKECIIKSINEA